MLEEEKLKREDKKKMEAAIATAPKEGAKMKLKQEEDISSQRML